MPHSWDTPVVAAPFELFPAEFVFTAAIGELMRIEH
jgi:hypothetical protein